MVWGENRQSMKINGSVNLMVFLGLVLLTVGFFFHLAADRLSIFNTQNPIANLQLKRVFSLPGDAGRLKMFTMKGNQSPSAILEEKIRAAFPEDPDTAVAIAKAESRLNPEVIGDKHLAWEDGRNGMSCGIFQIRVFPNRPGCEKLLDEDFNIEYARELYERSGWLPWSTFKSGRYKNFLI